MEFCESLWIIPMKPPACSRESGYVFSITPVLAVAVPDQAGSLYGILRLLGDNGVNLEYTYAFITRKKDLAYMVMRVADNEKAAQVLTQHGVKLITQEELDAL